MRSVSQERGQVKGKDVLQLGRQLLLFKQVLRGKRFREIHKSVASAILTVPASFIQLERANLNDNI